MKQIITTSIAALGLLFAADAAEDHHTHAETKVGPAGGRLITSVEPHVEFLVTKEKRVEIRFVDDSNKAVSPGAQEITVTLGDRSKPTKLTFTREGEKLVSSGPIPEGNDYPAVVQIREKAGAKAVNEKFYLNLTQCPTCQNAEYICTCGHHGKKEEKKE